MTKVNLLGTFSLINEWPLKFEASSPGEIIKSLCIQVKGFKELLSLANVCIIIDGIRSVHLDELSLPCIMETMDIVPCTSGSKHGGLIPALEILVGAAIIGAAIYFAPELGSFAPVLIGLGANLVAGGLTGLLFGSKALKSGKSADTNASTLFNGVQNMAQEGVPVPLAYGRCRIGSLVVSGQLTVNDVPV